jgi:hypothetical protein
MGNGRIQSGRSTTVIEVYCRRGGSPLAMDDGGRVGSVGGPGGCGASVRDEEGAKTTSSLVQLWALGGSSTAGRDWRSSRGMLRRGAR